MALSNNRDVRRMGDNVTVDLWAVPMKASTKVYQGSLCVIDAGYLAPGRTATGLIACGVSLDLTDNSSGGAGALMGTVRRGTFKFNNSLSADLIAQANVGTPCYIVDDTQVALVATGRSVAGLIIQVDADGVWVEVGVRSATGV
jgi:hypothetical protein